MSCLRRFPLHVFKKCSRNDSWIQKSQVKCSAQLLHVNSFQVANIKIATLSTLTSQQAIFTQIKEVKNGLEIFLPKDVNVKSNSFFVDYVWLYDHCRCSKCYRANTNQKEGDPRKLGMDIMPKDVHLTDTVLSIKWSDDHQYNYELNWILENIYEGYPRKPRKNPMKYWTGTLNPQEYPTVEFSSNANVEQFVRETLRHLLVYGFCLIKGVPPTLKGTEEVTKLICPLQRGVWGDGAFIIESQENYIDTAYLDVPLPPHNDGTHLVETPGLQVIHIIKQSDIGGETYILDGFKAVEILKQRDPFAFEYLSKTPVESAYKSEQQGFFYKHCETVLRLHPFTKDMLQVRYNFSDITPIKIIPQAEIRQFYQSYAALANILFDRSKHVVFRLQPGTMLLFDNWRLVHGRKSFQGERKLVGCFMSHKDFHSRARILGVL